MICDACKDAGYYNSVGSPVALDLAEKVHKECENPSTCPCQHSTGISYNGYSKEDDR